MSHAFALGRVGPAAPSCSGRAAPIALARPGVAPVVARGQAPRPRGGRVAARATLMDTLLRPVTSLNKVRSPA